MDGCSYGVRLDLLTASTCLLLLFFKIPTKYHARHSENSFVFVDIISCLFMYDHGININETKTRTHVLLFKYNNKQAMS